jgi:hypothetical protein
MVLPRLTVVRLVSVKVRIVVLTAKRTGAAGAEGRDGATTSAGADWRVAAAGPDEREPAQAPLTARQPTISIEAERTENARDATIPKCPTEKPQRRCTPGE